MSNGFVIVAPSNASFFTNANQYDFLFYTASNSQKLLFGVNSNAPASLTFSSNLCSINGNIAINNSLAVNGLSIAMNNGTTANITTTSVQGHSNTSNGLLLYMPSNTSNNQIVFQGSNTTLATLTGTANLYLGSNIGPGYSNYPTDLSGNTGNIVTSGNISAGNLGMFRNRIINGNMAINQRGITSLALPNGTSTFTVDRFFTWCSGSGSITFSNVSLISTDTPYQYGIRSSFRNTVTTAFGTSSANTVNIYQNIEGYNIQDFNWGTTFASSVAVSFWVRAIGVTSLAVSIQPSGGAYCYNTNISIANSATWQYVTTIIPPPPIASASAWGTGTSCGLGLLIGPVQYGGIGQASGTGWVVGNSISTTSTSPWITAVGNYVEFTGVQLEKGPIATPFEFRSYTIELQLCQRYCASWNTSGNIGIICGNNSSPIAWGKSAIIINLPQVMRTAPTAFSLSGSTATILYDLPNYIGGICGTSTNMTLYNSSPTTLTLFTSTTNLAEANLYLAVLSTNSLLFVSAEL